MKVFIKKSGLILLLLLAVIGLAGKLLPGDTEEATVEVVAEQVLVPGGQSVGVKMDVSGVLVVGLEEITTEDGEKVNPGLISGLEIGDMVLEVDGTEVSNADEVQSLVNNIQNVVKLKIKRNDQVKTVNVNPVKSAEDGLYKLGIWVKDKTAGIGTLTYYDPDSNTFGALGHGIVDSQTNAILSVESGELLQAEVQEVEEGKKGEPGEIKGIFYNASSPLGNLVHNSEFGVFGIAADEIVNPLYSEPLVVATREQVVTGPAYILTTLENNQIGRYQIEIEKVEDQDAPQDKSMVIRVTDEVLLAESGGIVQGMSGSPILQNNRIVGAVTHVFIDDPSRGYGVFIEWMLHESNSVEY
jgi:stage IV sporulation protein B